MLTVLPLRSMSCTLGNSSSLQAAGDDHSCRYYNSLSAKKDILKNFFVYLMMTNVMVKTGLNQKIMKNSNLVQAMKNSLCPTANVTRRPVFSESRILRSFRIVDSTLDMIVVRWQLLNFSKAEFVRIFTECSEVWIEHVDWTHVMIIVKWHLFIWHERKLCALTNAPPVQFTQTGQWLSTLFHANCSSAQVYVLYPRQFIFAPSCRRWPFLQVLQSTER